MIFIWYSWRMVEIFRVYYTSTLAYVSSTDFFGGVVYVLRLVIRLEEDVEIFCVTSVLALCRTPGVVEINWRRDDPES